jgi:hypothetical protein
VAAKVRRHHPRIASKPFLWGLTDAKRVPAFAGRDTLGTLSIVKPKGSTMRKKSRTKSLSQEVPPNNAPEDDEITLFTATETARREDLLSIVSGGPLVGEPHFARVLEAIWQGDIDTWKSLNEDEIETLGRFARVGLLDIVREFLDSATRKGQEGP